MARRNRKKTRQLNGFIIPVRFASVVIIGALLGLTYVWLGCRGESLGRELKQLEKANEELDRLYRVEEYKWTRLKHPKNINRILKSSGLDMNWPRGDQVVRLYDAEDSYTRLVASAQDASKVARLGRNAMNE